MLRSKILPTPKRRESASETSGAKGHLSLVESAENASVFTKARPIGGIVVSAGKRARAWMRSGFSQRATDYEYFAISSCSCLPYLTMLA